MFQSAFQGEEPPFHEPAEAPFCFSPNSTVRSHHLVALSRPRVFSLLLIGLSFKGCRFLRSPSDWLPNSSGPESALMLQYIHFDTIVPAVGGGCPRAGTAGCQLPLRRRQGCPLSKPAVSIQLQRHCHKAQPSPTPKVEASWGKRPEERARRGRMLPSSGERGWNRVRDSHVNARVRSWGAGGGEGGGEGGGA